MFKIFSKPVGIIGYSSYIPSLKLAVKEIVDLQKKSSIPVSNFYKAVPDYDEDVITFSLNILSQLKESFINVDFSKVGSIYVDSESFPYAVKPVGTILGEYLNLRKYSCANLEFPCKAGTAAMQIVTSEVLSGMVKMGLAIGVDIAQAKPGDNLEATAGAGGAGFLIGSDEELIIAKFLATASISTNTPDFWRRAGQKFPEHTGRFTGIPGYINHVSGIIEYLLKFTKMKASDIDFLVLHSPNLKFPDYVSKKHDFKTNSLVHRKLFKQIGNAYAGSSMLGLAHTLDKGKPGDYVLMVSYGSGAGADAFLLEITGNIVRNRAKTPLSLQISTASEISYLTYLKNRNLL